MSKQKEKIVPIVEAIEDRIVGIPFEIEVVSESGIVCDSGQLPQGYMKVISCGPKVVGIKPDDIVLTPKHGGQSMIHMGVLYQVFAPQEIYGKLNGTVEKEQSSIIKI